jgi:uncharacterized protein YcbK (DUF882 family)
MSIKLRDAAEFFKKEQHQIDAWNWLEAQLKPETLEEFANKYRNKPKPKEEISNTWDGVYAAAKKAGAKFPECVCAQWALESGWGKHFSGTWNAFGLKGSGSAVSTQEFINGKWITITASFIDFPDLETCVFYLVERWYKDFGRFKGVNRAKTRNECAQLLVVEKYATDPNYSTKLIQIMDREVGTPGNVDVKKEEEKKDRFNPWSPFTYKITPNITYGELTLNQEARRFSKQYQCDTALELCQFLEKVRAAFGNKPLIITSASRPEPINTQVGGSKNSEHTYNAPSKGAIDFYIEGANIYVVQDWCNKNWPYSLGYGALKGFTHIGIRPERIKIRWDY